MGDDSRTLYCGNLSSRCNESILYELFLQGGPLDKVHIPKDRDGGQKNFGFITYKHPISVPYAISLFDGTSLFNRTLTLKCRPSQELVSPPSQPLTHIPQQFQMQMNYPNINPMLQLGNQMFMNQVMPMNMVPMFLPPGLATYPSQINSQSLSKDDRHRGSRNHPYHNDRDNDRYRDRDHLRNDRERDRDRDRYSDYGHRNQNHHKDHRSQHKGSNGYSRNNRHYR